MKLRFMKPSCVCMSVRRTGGGRKEGWGKDKTGREGRRLEGGLGSQWAKD